MIGKKKAAPIHTHRRTRINSGESGYRTKSAGTASNTKRPLPANGKVSFKVKAALAMLAVDE